MTWEPFALKLLWDRLTTDLHAIFIGTPVADGTKFPPGYVPPGKKLVDDRPNPGRPIEEPPEIELEEPDLVINYYESPVSPNTGNTYIQVNNNYQIVLAPQVQTRINIPPRRLPREADGQTDFDTPNGRSIDIKQSLAERSFGKLLHKPFNDQEFEIPIAVPTLLREEFQEYVKKGEERFAFWAFNQVSGGWLDRSVSDNNLNRENEAIEFWQELKEQYPDIEEPIQFWEASALISTNILRGFQGTIGFIFGQKALHFLAQDYAIGRSHAYQDITGVIPIKYKIKEFDPKIEATYRESQSLFNNSNNSLTQKIYEILGGGQWVTASSNSGFAFNPEAEFKEYIANAFTKDSNSNIELRDESKTKRIRNFIDLINYNASTFYYRLGLFDYPQHLPKDLTLNDKKMRDEFEENYDKDDEYDPELYSKINNQTQYNSWFLKQFDGLIGQFPIEINIEDSDLMKVGDQKLELKFPNVAETLAELLGLSLNVKAYLEANLNASMRTLAEVGSTKKQAITHYYLTAALQDYLGFKSKKKTIEVPFLYNPAAGSSKEEPDSLANALKTTKQKVEIEESDDENTLEKHMATLIESARITKAVHWRKTDAPDLKNWKEFIKNAVDFATGEAEEEEGDLDDLFKDIEEGFINATAIPDKKNPYGRPYEQRPKIRNLKPEEET